MTSKLLGAVAVIGAFAIAAPALAQTVTVTAPKKLQGGNETSPSYATKFGIYDRTTLHEPVRDERLAKAKAMSPDAPGRIDRNFRRVTMTMPNRDVLLSQEARERAETARLNNDQRD